MKKAVILLMLSIATGVAFSQTEFKIRNDSVNHEVGLNETKVYFEGDKYYIRTTQDSISFNKPLIVNGVPLSPEGFKQPLDSLTLNKNLAMWGDDINEYTFVADSLTKLMAFSDENGKLNYFSFAKIPFLNNTLDTIFRGQALSSKGIGVVSGRALPTADITKNDNLSLVSTFAGVACCDIPPGKIGRAIPRGILENYDLTDFSVNDELYVDPNGYPTNIPPETPLYKAVYGRVFDNSINGTVGVTATAFTGSDTDVNIQGIINGLITAKQAIRDTIISNILYFETYNENYPEKDLSYIYNGTRYNLNTTTNNGTNGYARTQLVYGTANQAQKNYIYINHNSGNASLGVRTTGFANDDIRLAVCGVYDQAIHESKKFKYFQRFNNEINGSNANGLQNKTVKRIRLDGARYESGLQGTFEDITSAGVDSLKFSTGSGVVWQFNRQIAKATDRLYYKWGNSSIGDSIISDLNKIAVDANGNTLIQNNYSYVLTLFYIQNSGELEDYIYVLAPNGSYKTSGGGSVSDETAVYDYNNTAILDVPQDLKGTAIRLARIVVEYDDGGGGNFINLVQSVVGEDFIDDRGQPLGATGGLAGGGGGGGGDTYPVSDAIFSISNDTDPTKILGFDASGLTTGTTRTLTIPDASGEIAIGVQNFVTAVTGQVGFQNINLPSAYLDNDYTLLINSYNTSGYVTPIGRGTKSAGSFEIEADVDLTIEVITIKN